MPGGAYPRSRGGTGGKVYTAGCCNGLSPLTRGNLWRMDKNGRPQGPIPAHAGEPIWALRCDPVQRAYPRSRGGTALKRTKDMLHKGLSPLTRGNLKAVEAKVAF